MGRWTLAMGGGDLLKMAALLHLLGQWQRSPREHHTETRVALLDLKGHRRRPCQGGEIALCRLTLVVGGGDLFDTRTYELR